MIGLDTWGASGPIDELYRHFGLDAESVALKIKQALEKRP
jgi:transketolase